VILERASDDLGGGGTSSVREKHEWNRRRDGIITGDEVLVFPVAGADAGDRQPFLQKEIADAQRLIENAAGVSAQIDDDSPCALARQAGDRAFELVSRALIELEERDVPDFIVEHYCVRNGRYGDDRARESDRYELGHAWPRELDENSAPGTSLQCIGRLLDGPAAGVSGVDEVAPIALLHTGRFGWCMRKDPLHADESLRLWRSPFRCPL
jgi:hypothetical protein